MLALGCHELKEEQLEELKAEGTWAVKILLVILQECMRVIIHLSVSEMHTTQRGP